jgi:hypothetical protein
MPACAFALRRVLLNRPGSGPVFARQHIAACMAKVQLMDLQETLQVSSGECGQPLC